METQDRCPPGKTGCFPSGFVRDLTTGSRDRPDLYVVARLLESLWRAPEPMLKTRLQVAANVNYDVFSRYLEGMRIRGLVAVEDSVDGQERIWLTPGGHEPDRKPVPGIHQVVHGRMPGG